MTIEAIDSCFKKPIDDTTLQKIALDGLFMSILRAFAKAFLAKESALLQNKCGMTATQINKSSSDISGNDNYQVLKAIQLLFSEVVAGASKTHKAYADEIKGFEVLFSYDEASQFTSTTRDAFGIEVDPTFSGFITAGAGSIYGKLDQKHGDGSEKLSGATSWSGVDMVIVAMLGDYVRLIPDFSSVSFSINRNKVNVHALGSVNRKGHTNGPRTVAGTMIGLVLKDEPLKGLQPQVIEDLSGLDQMGQSASPYREFLLPDQLPDFDLLVTIQNEFGHMARIGLFGITISDVGQVISINDTQTEISYTYTATDIDLLTYEGTSKSTTGSSFSLSLDAYKERRNRIDEGRTTHNSPYSVPEFWDIWDPEKRIVLEPADLAITSEAPDLSEPKTQAIVNLKPTASIQSYKQKTEMAVIGIIEVANA